MKRLLTLVLPVISTTSACLFGAYQDPDCGDYCGDCCGLYNSYGASTYLDCTGDYDSFSDMYMGRHGVTFEGSIAPMWLKPHGSNLDYAVQTFTLAPLSPSWKVYEVHPDYSLGYDASFKIYFNRCKTWVTLDYQHFHSSNSAHVVVDDLANRVGPFFEVGPEAAVYKQAHGNASFTLDELNLDYGISFDFCDRLRTSLFGGVSFARVRQTLNNRYSSLDDVFSRSIEVPSNFRGVGPQLGIDFAYKVWECLDVTGSSVGAILIGEQSNHTEFQSFSPNLVKDGQFFGNDQFTHVKERTQSVPVFTQRLGLAYSILFCCCYDLTIEAGYEAKVYFNAIQSVDISSEVVNVPEPQNSDAVNARTFHRTLSNFVLSGPYLNLSLAF